MEKTFSNKDAFNVTHSHEEIKHHNTNSQVVNSNTTTQNSKRDTGKINTLQRG